MRTGTFSRSEAKPRAGVVMDCFLRIIIPLRCKAALCVLLGTQAPAADGIFVAVGGGGRIMSSRDGLNWETAQEWDSKWADDSNLLHWVTSGLGKIVASGGGGWSRDTQAGHILVSTDGKAWREVAKLPNRVSPVLFSGDRFVCAGGGDGTALRWSLDGEKWEAGATYKEFVAVQNAPAADGGKPSPLKGVNFRRGAAGNGVFLFTGDASEKTNWQLTTRDGTTLTSFTRGTPQCGSVAFGAGKFVLAGRDGIFTSADAQKWQREPGTPADELWRVEWSGREFIVAGKKSFYRSSDGTTWQSFGGKPPGWIAAASAHGHVAMSWGANLFFSPDGQTWKRVTQPNPARQMERVIFADNIPDAKR